MPSGIFKIPNRKKNLQVINKLNKLKITYYKLLCIVLMERSLHCTILLIKINYLVFSEHSSFNLVF